PALWRRARSAAQDGVRSERSVRDPLRPGGRSTMTTTRSMRTGTMTIGEIIGAFATGEPPLRIEAYDGSSIGPADSELVLRLKSEKALQYFVTAPGDLGLARAYLMGELEVEGVHPGAPRDVFGSLELFRTSMTRTPDVRTMARIARSIGIENVKLLDRK